MDNGLLEELLNEDESSSLDFKLEQYLFAGASEDQKSEIIKDVLAFANAWRRTDAYILVGIEEVRGGRSIVRGVTNHLSESDIQQLVNSKTNRPIEFSYRAFLFEGKQLGVFHIPVQDRPFYLTSKYGKLNKSIVYVRRGSSTDIADVDEIARMGASNVVAAQIPTLDLQFADSENREPKGKSISIESLVLRLPERSQIPKARRESTNPFGFDVHLGSINSNYYREYANYFFVRSLVQPIGFVLENTGATLLINARLHLLVPQQNNLQLYTEAELPDPPVFDNLPISLRGTVPAVARTADPIQIEKRGNSYEVWIDFGNVQPKARAWSDVIYLGAQSACTLNIEPNIYADNLSNPVRTTLSLAITTHGKSMSVEGLREAISQLAEEELKRFDDEDE